MNTSSGERQVLLISHPEICNTDAPANESMIEVHDRMPVIAQEDGVRPYPIWPSHFFRLSPFSSVAYGCYYHMIPAHSLRHQLIGLPFRDSLPC